MKKNFASIKSISEILHLLYVYIVFFVDWKGIYSRSDTNKTGAEGVSFYYPKPLYCPDQMLEVMLLSQNRVPKPSDFGLHVVPNVRNTLLERGLRFVQRRRNRISVKERDPICAGTNGIAQNQSSGG